MTTIRDPLDTEVLTLSLSPLHSPLVLMNMMDLRRQQYPLQMPQTHEKAVTNTASLRARKNDHVLGIEDAYISP